MNEEIDVTPSPRVLRMLGEIDFKAWQCLCEIIDNSIDSFSSYDFQGDVEKRINIALPSTNKNNIKDTDKLVIEDNGVGMSLAQLNDSLKAGFSHNNSVDKMGLFGMGFNIATARLGARTEILTTRKGDENWLKVVIDFHDLENSTKGFKVPITQIPKRSDESSVHGTTVSITKLRKDHVKNLYSKKIVRDKLGKIYGRLLRERDVTIFYHGTPCLPFKHCIWDSKRVGEHKKTSVPAVIKIDELIDEKRYCHTCWVWLSEYDRDCPSCGKNSALEKREKRVKGWLGLQRYFHSDHYGIDLLRNGRVIKELDKSFFFWQNEDEEIEPEYPVDGHSKMGRIVGELEIDFVQVTHQKDAFLTNSNDWKHVERVVRGDGPIRPLIAKDKGYAENSSPLAKLFGAFRTAKAGIKNLVPARPNGQAMIQDAHINELVRKFREGEEDYLSDEKWWDLVISYSSGKKDSNDDDDDPTGGNPFGPDPDGDDDDDNGTISQPDGSKEDDDFKENKEVVEPDRELSGLYSLDDIFNRISIRVNAEVVNTGEHQNGFEVKLRGSEIFFRSWPKSKIYTHTLLRPADFLINELAYHFHNVSQNELSIVPITQIELRLREAYFPDLSPNVSEINNSISLFIESLRDHISVNLKNIPDFDSSILGTELINDVKKKLAQNELLESSKIDDAVKKGEFINYLSAKGISIILKNYPEIVFDGEFFNLKIQSRSEKDILSFEMCREISTIMDDILWLLDNKTASSKPLWRGHAKRMIGGLEIISAWRA